MVKDFEEGLSSETAAELSVTSGTKRSWSKWMFFGVVAIIAVSGIWKAYGWLNGGAVALGGTYQAVFLDNNQVYFGRLTNTASAYPILKDIYYLRVTQPLQPPEGGAAQPDINLVKLGTELHGPADEMRINREHILFIEDLKADSEVTKAITSFKAAQNK